MKEQEELLESESGLDMEENNSSTIYPNGWKKHNLAFCTCDAYVWNEKKSSFPPIFKETTSGKEDKHPN